MRGRAAPGALVMLLGLGLVYWSLLGLGIIQTKTQEGT